MHGFSYHTALTWIPLLPILAAIIHGFVGRTAEKSVVTGLALGSIATSFVLSVICAMRAFGLGDAEPTRLVAELGTWFSLQGDGGRAIPIDIAFVMDGLSAVMAVMVTGVGLLIHIYASSYMHDDEGYARFFAYLNLFTGAMLLLVLASSLPVLFVGWEGVGVCSYLLIGFWFKTPEYAAAAKKAFVVNRIGDLGVLIAMLLLAFDAGSVDLAEINARVPTLLSSFATSVPVLTTTAVALLLFLGCAGKSAQMPLYVWLPDAMAGPTPVSALIHAATMVTAGVYLCCRLSPVFLASPVAMTVIGVVGAVTALVGGFIALAQKDLKKILAYSTVSQLGFMFGAIGVGAFSAAIFHVFTHAFFKACLFLGAGSVMHAVAAHGDADVTKLGGLMKKLPWTFRTFAVSTFSIAGFPFLAGFYSKDAILAGALGAALHGGDAVDPKLRMASYFVLGALSFGALLTAFYMTRCLLLVFSGDYKGVDAGYDAEPHESPRAMTVPLVVLALGAIVVGFLALGEPSAWTTLLGSSVRDLALSHEAHASAHTTAMIIGTVAALVGIGAGFAAFWNKPDSITANPDGFFAFFTRGMYIDTVLGFVVGGFVRYVATFLAAIDRTFLAPMTLDLPALKGKIASMLVVRVQDGYVQTYGVFMAAGLFGALAWIETPRVVTEIETTTTTATFHVAGGLGQTIRVDLDSDGEWDDTVDGSGTFTMRYDAEDLRGLALTFVLPPNDIHQTIRLTRAPQRIDSTLGRFFRNPEAHSAVAVLARAVGRKAYLRPNGETLSLRNARSEEPAFANSEVELVAGEGFTLGRAPARVLSVVRATIEVTNVFGHSRRERIDVVLEPAPRGSAPPPPPDAAHGEHPEEGAR